MCGSEPANPADEDDLSKRSDSLSCAISRTWLLRASLVFVVLGLVWRLARYGLQFPIWGDEAFVCLNFLDRDFAGMVGPLKCGQVAPLLFLWGELAVYKSLGGSELAVRLLPLLAGLGSLALFFRLAWRTLPPLAATFAVGMLAVAYWPVAMSSTVKPYSLDLLMALALLVPAVEWLRRPDRRGWLWLLVVLCPVAVFSSYPAVFVGGAVSLAILTTLGRRTPVSHASAIWAWVLFALFNLGLLTSFAVHFRVVALVQLEQESGRLQNYLQTYWQDGFPPADLGDFVRWLVLIHTGRMCAYPVGAQAGGSILTTALMAVGLLHVFRRETQSDREAGWVPWPTMLLLLVPFGLNFLAALIHKYPYGGCCRLSQHLAPAICLLAGQGAACLIGRLASSELRRRWVLGSFAVLAAIPVLGVARDLWRPYKGLPAYRARAEIRDFFAARFSPGDRIIVTSPPEQVDPVHCWLLSQSGHRIEWGEDAPDLRTAPRVWRLSFVSDPCSDVEALHFGQLSVQHARFESVTPTVALRAVPALDRDQEPPSNAVVSERLRRP